MIKNIIKYCIVFIIMIGIFILTLYITSLIPSSSMKQNVAESAQVLLKEGNRKKVYIKSKELIVLFDNYTDALMINTAYSIDNTTPLYSAFTAKKNYIPGITKTIEEDVVSELKSASKYGNYYNPVGELYDVANDDIDESFEYARYWHGYLVILRPLLVLFNITQIRIILIVIFVALLMFLLYEIGKKISPFIAIIFFVGLAGVEYFYIGISIHETPIFIIMMTVATYLLIKNGNIKNVAMIFFILGILTSFFDLLSVPILTYGFPILVYFMLQQKNRHLSFKESTVIFIETGLAWVIGYIAMWFTKWILIDLIYDRNLLQIALEQVRYRSIGNGENIQYTLILERNLKYIIVPAILNIAIAIIIRIIKGSDNKSIKQKLEQKYPYILIGTIPLIWYFALKNHSYNHSFFTYRNLLLTVLALPFTILISNKIYRIKMNAKKARKYSRNKMLKE